MERSRFSERKRGTESRERSSDVVAPVSFVSFRFVRSFVYLTQRRVGSILKRPIKSLRNGNRREISEKTEPR